MYYVYLLRCADGTLYAGFTNDLARRLAEDPGSGLPAGEREELLAAAVRSRECGLPLRRACRVCRWAA